MIVAALLIALFTASCSTGPELGYQQLVDITLTQDECGSTCITTLQLT